jgi:hypothetical protein
LLPFSKRPARHDDEEDLLTGDIIEVVRPSQGARGASSRRFPEPSSERPRVFRERNDSVADNEVTMLMPSKSITLPPPPRGAAARTRKQLPTPTTPPSRRDLAAAGDEHTSFRPPNTLPPPPRTFPPPPSRTLPPPSRTAPPPSRRAVAFGDSTSPPSPRSVFEYPEPSTPPPPASSPNPFARQAPLSLGAMHAPITMSPHAPDSTAPVAMSMPMPMYGVRTPSSQPHLDPPGTVITTRTRLLTGRPVVSWAAALVAMGVFAGLVTAVLARGDGDSAETTASFVDTEHAASAAAQAAPGTAAAAAPAADPAAAPTAPSTAGAGDPAAATAADAPKAAPSAPSFVYAKPMTPVADPVAAAAPKADKTDKADKAPTADKPEPKAAAPKPEPKRHADAPSPRPHPAPVARERAEPTPAPAPTTARKGHGGGDGDANGNAEAERARDLADKQLQQILGQ